MKTKSGFLIDYFTFSTRDFTAEDIKVILGLDGFPWELANGKWFFEDGEYFMHIKLLYNGKGDNMANVVTCEMTGQGCRVFESIGLGDWDFLFSLVASGSITVTRLDPAFDDKDGLIDFQRLIQDTMSKDGDNFDRLVSEYKTALVEYSMPASRGSSIYWGSKRSNSFFRVYDKAKEQHLVDEHWIRFECQLRKEEAHLFLKTAQLHYDGDWSRLFFEYLCKKVRFVEKPPNSLDTNIRRYPTAIYWETFLHGVSKAKPFERTKLEYTQEHLRKYVTQQAGQSILCLAEIDGYDNVMAKIAQERQGKKPNPKYKNLIEEHKLALLSEQVNSL